MSFTQQVSTLWICVHIWIRQIFILLIYHKLVCLCMKYSTAFFTVFFWQFWMSFDIKIFCCVCICLGMLCQSFRLPPKIHRSGTKVCCIILQLIGAWRRKVRGIEACIGLHHSSISWATEVTDVGNSFQRWKMPASTCFWNSWKNVGISLWYRLT